MADRLSKQLMLEKGLDVYIGIPYPMQKLSYAYRLAPLSVIKFCKQQKGVCI
jgi:hypothetical protein